MFGKWIVFCFVAISSLAMGWAGYVHQSMAEVAIERLPQAQQENISGVLIERNMQVIDGVNHYDFSVPIIFWMSAAVLSLILGSTLWNAKTSD